MEYEIISDVTEVCAGVIEDYDVNKIRLHRIDWALLELIKALQSYGNVAVKSCKFDHFALLFSSGQKTP